MGVNFMETTNKEFEIKLNLKNYRDFNFYHFYKNFKSLLFLLCIPIIIIGLPIMSYYYIKTSDLFLLLLLVTDLVLAIFLFILLPLSILINSQLFFNNDNFLQEKQSFIVSEEKILIKTISSEVNIYWKKTFKTVETKNYFFIYSTKAKAFILPKEQINKETILFIKEQVEK